MPEMPLKQPGFTYSACGPVTKNKERIKTFKETGDSRYICQNELNKACFHHDIAYGDFKYFIDEYLLIKYYVIKHLILLKIQNMMDISVDLLEFFNKKTSGGTVKN